jgi:hypothetical protein
MTLGVAEGAVTIIAASVPILRPLFRSNKPRPAIKFLYNEDQWEESLPSEGSVKTTITSQPRISLEIDRKSLMPKGGMWGWVKSTEANESAVLNSLAEKTTKSVKTARRSAVPAVRQTEGVDVRVSFMVDDAMGRRRVERKGIGNAI